MPIPSCSRNSDHQYTSAQRLGMTTHDSVLF